MAFPPKKDPSQGLQINQNAPLYPPNPSDLRAASPGPTPTAPPAVSPTQDNYTHHSSPNPGQVQQQMPPGPPSTTKPPLTGGAPKRIVVPPHVTKHPNPVGRPKTPND